MSIPNPMHNTLRAALGLIPWIPRTPVLPTEVIRVKSVSINPDHVGQYSALTGLHYGNTVPLTYPFVITFPAVMQLITRFDFPFTAVGLVHVENHIQQLHPVMLTDVINIKVYADQIREHRKGLLVDIHTTVSVGHRLAWRQRTTFLHHQRTSLSDQPKPQPDRSYKLPPPTALLRVSSQQIRRYAMMSGDFNPIHTSVIGAKLFGFPTMIAHGMYSAARVLANIEPYLPDAVDYSLRFHKPMLLPAKPGLYVDQVGSGWNLALRNTVHKYPYLTATVSPWSAQALL